MGWYNTSWNYRIKITIDHTKVGADALNFPVLVYENDSSQDQLDDHFWANVKSDGSDIIITQSDGTTKQKRELVKIDTSAQTLELYTKTNLSSSVDTEIYLYYGYTSASETNDSDTWHTEFQGVYHMNLSGSNCLDSTSNSVDGTAYNQTHEVPAKIGNGLDFDGSWPYDYVDIGNAGGIGIGSITAMVWINIDKIPINGSNIINANGYVLCVGRVFGDRIGWYRYAGGWTAFNHVYVPLTGSTICIMHTYNASTGDSILYINGVYHSTINSSAVPMTDAGLVNRIGFYQDSSYVYNGWIDEIYCTNDVKDADWAGRLYNNQNDPTSFYSSLSHEVLSGGTKFINNHILGMTG